MAAEDITAALQGLQFAPIESPYGMASAALGKALPNVITPYTSTGKALGVTLGGVLLQSLLGYQARKQAAQNTLQTMELANTLSALPTAQERVSFIKGIDQPMYQERLSTLATALSDIEQQRKLAQAAKLADLTTAAQFELGPLGTQVYERDIAKEIARQSAITGGFQNRQELADALMRGRALQREELGLERVNVPSPIFQRAIERNASSDLALDVAGAIDQYKSIPQFAAAKSISAFGDDQLKSRLRNVATVVLQSRSGLAATDKERENLNKILTGDFTAVSPDTVSGLLKRFAQDEKELAATSVAAGTQRPEAFVNELRAAAKEGRKSAFTPRIPEYATGQVVTQPTPIQDEKLQILKDLQAQIAAEKAKRGR